MADTLPRSCTAFSGHRRLRSGSLAEVAQAVRTACGNEAPPVLVFDDTTGRVVDLDMRSSAVELAAQEPRTTSAHGSPAPVPEEATEVRGRGRPRLGVVPREVTLLPRHWEWLAAQPGGASAVLRRLVDEARRNGRSRQRERAAQEAAYHFMLAIAGDLPGYEEATRALFAGNLPSLEQSMADWPADIRIHALRLASGAADRPADDQAQVGGGLAADHRSGTG